MTTDTLDEAYTRLDATGPEFDGWLSNHGPMAADALIRLGRNDIVEEWVDGYRKRLESLPRPRWPIPATEWREPLGDASRLGDWLALFSAAVDEAPWRDVLATWWPRLLPGGLAASTHGLIRTGHAVRALLEHTSAPRVAELGQALGYWASRWQPMPGTPRPSGYEGVDAALAAVPAVEALSALDGGSGSRARAAALLDLERWPLAVSALRPPPEPGAVPAALDALTDAAVSRYPGWAAAGGNPVMLVHAATAPRAAGLVLRALPVELWPATHDAAWAICAAIAGMYRPATKHSATRSATDAAGPDPWRPADAADAADQAADHGDEHVIKLSEVAVESHGRGNPAALSAAGQAIRLVGRG